MKRRPVVLFDEYSSNPIISRIRRQRRSLFNYVITAVATSIGLFALLAAIGLAAPMVAQASASVGVGLWPTDYRAQTADCGSPDTNNFCSIDDDPNAVELGVKFTTAKPVVITGVRVYRVDDASEVTGSLWLSDSTLMATGKFGGWQFTNGWQDMVFDPPIPIKSGVIYIASYFSPQAKYAFEHGFFSNSAFTVGPITMLQSVKDSGNGVYTYCYIDQPCDRFPTDSFWDTNYWVTPLWMYKFNGFYQPVDNGAWNTAKAGSAIPVKFNLGGNLGLDILKTEYPKATLIPCPDAGTFSDLIEETVTASSSRLTYDAAAAQYVYAWKTSQTWVGKCYRFDLGLNDDTSHTFDIQFVK